MAKYLRWLWPLGLCLFSANALAQSFPSRPIGLVVGFAPGGGADAVARAIAPEISRVLGQQVVVDNRPGAGGIIGAEFVVRSAPDGYTIFIGGPGPNAIAHSLYAKVPYDSARDFAPISLLSENPNLLVVHPSLPAASVADLIALARKSPGKYSYSSAGNGSSMHLAGALFASMAQVNLLHVPYRGVADGLNGVMSGDVTMLFAPLQNAVALIKAGRLKVLGVTTPHRSPVMPDVPTISESGLSGYEQTVWNALLAPSGTPPENIAILNSAVAKALAAPEVVARLRAIGVEPAASSPERAKEFMLLEIQKWGKVIRDSGAKVD
ncbi:MAG: Bug family tripartite tricarboxylate transporter substrate binding protein [Lautropia sp.]